MTIQGWWFRSQPRGSDEPRRQGAGHEEGLASASALGLPSSHAQNTETNKQTKKHEKEKKKKTQKRLSGWHSAETPGMQEHLRGQDDQKLVPLFLMFYDLERKGKTFATFLNAENE